MCLAGAREIPAGYLLSSLEPDVMVETPALLAAFPLCQPRQTLTSLTVNFMKKGIMICNTWVFVVVVVLSLTLWPI